jgi:hypothetical protein
MEADPQSSRPIGLQEGYGRGWERPHIHEDDSFLKTLLRDSIFNPRNTRPVWDQGNAYTLGGRIGHLAAALQKDLSFDGSRVPYWALNHPLAMMSVVGRTASEAGGFQMLSKDYRQMEAEIREQAKGLGADRHISRDEMRDRWKAQQGYRTDIDPRALPHNLAATALPVLASAALVQASGNHDLLNLAQGGRSAGYQAVIPTQGDLTQTSNPVLEAVARYVFGRTGRVLPWEQFTEERPDVGPEDYAAYKRHQFDGGVLDIGLIKGTSRNLEGEPEGTMMGFRVPLSAAGTGLGALGAGVIGAHVGGRGVSPGTGSSDSRLLTRVGPRRMAGSLLGGVLGAIAGNLGTRAANAVVIQPLLNPEAVAAQAEWIQQQQARGLV